MNVEIEQAHIQNCPRCRIGINPQNKVGHGAVEQGGQSRIQWMRIERSQCLNAGRAVVQLVNVAPQRGRLVKQAMPPVGKSL